MTGGTDQAHDRFRRNNGDRLARVQQLDPDCGDEAVDEFFAEIDAANAVLWEIDAADQALPISFNAKWSDTDAFS